MSRNIPLKSTVGVSRIIESSWAIRARKPDYEEVKSLLL